MSFTSLSFLLFLAVSLLLYYMLPRKMQLPVLLTANLIFYLSGGLSYFFFLATTIVTVFFSAKKIDEIGRESKLKAKEIEDKSQRKEYKAVMKKKQKTYLLACFFVNFGILAVLKYTNFVISNVNYVLSSFHSQTQFQLLDLILPLGLSFYTFQSISYLLDVYWDKEKAEESFFKYAVFASFFPQMIQGPISRFGKVSPTLYGTHDFDKDGFYEGFIRMLYGFFKKLVVADRLLPIIGQLTKNPEEYQGIYFLIAMFLYAVALFADFSGGIDITIAVGKMFGITLQENFNKPYSSRSITEYWRRWHMTVGGWFRDYLFYPLSVSKFMLKISSNARKKLGNNMGKRVPFYISTLTIWFATGIWHGATWNYIAWGFTNGIVILISQELTPLYQNFHKKYPNMQENKAFIGFTIVRTFWLMCFIRAFDCYSSVGVTLKMHLSVLTNFSFSQFAQEGLTTLNYEPIQWIASGLGVVVMIFVGYFSKNDVKYSEILVQKSLFTKTAAVYFLLFSILLFGAYGMGYDSSQFIYNQF